MNLDKPYYFNEKLMWLKYYNYNKNKLCEQCYDKFLVREFVTMSGCAGILNELYGVWDNVNDIPWDELPDEYVIKRTNGCQQHIFRRKGELIDPIKASKLLTDNTKQQRKNFITSGDLFATRNHQKYICEKLLYSNLGYASPEDYKFYCFNGEPRYVLFIMDRHDGVFTEAFMTIDFEDRSCFFDTAENYKIEKPVCYDLMLEICRKLSKPFPFVRVDLYVQSGRPVFGELTFTPAGGLVLYHTFNKNGDINYPALEEMGNLLKIR